MPLREYLCRGCGHTWEELIRSSADLPKKCPHCDTRQIEQLISTYGGYQGNFSTASTRPRHSGAFAGRRKS